MFCTQDSDDPLGGSVSTDQEQCSEKDPFASASEDEEPPAKKMAVFEPSLNLTVYKIPAYSGDVNGRGAKENIQKRFSGPDTTVKIYPNSYETTPIRYKKNGEIAKKRGPKKGYKRTPKSDSTFPYLPNISPSLTITPVPMQPPKIRLPHDTSLTITPSAPPALPPGLTIQPAGPRHNGARLPQIPIPTVQEMAAMTQALSSPELRNLTLGQRNAVLSTLLMSNAIKLAGEIDIQEVLKHLGVPPMSMPSSLSITPERIQHRMSVPTAPVVPKGVEVLVVECAPEDWFPSEPYRMCFSRKKNQKWKSFPYQCEHCFKGYRVASSLVSHAGERHGCVPRSLALPCPCCQHVSVRRKQHRRHLASHAVRKNKLFCLFCIPPQGPSEAYVPETQRYPYDDFPHIYFASEESLRLHRKRKHPEVAFFNSGWNFTWMNPATYS